MNILLIGNGFDLAHGLKTTYKDFLRFIVDFKIYKEARENNVQLVWKDNEDISFYKYFIELFKEGQTNKDKEKIINQLNEMIEDNVWLKHFKDAQIKEGWIDFESEISKVVQTLEKVRKDNVLMKNEINIEEYQKGILKHIGVGFKDNKDDIEKAIRISKEIGLEDLNKLIRCLEIYLSDYINNVIISEEKILLDIKKLRDIDNVLSFNYTNTYERLYGIYNYSNRLQEFDYIHGKADIKNTVYTNNMVLGIDEYLKGDEKNENIEFIAFKKFYQRIHKETGCRYRNWIAEIKSTEHNKLFIFGHSLDITDKDVLRDLILNDNIKTVIFYMNKDDYGRKIANLVKLIGQDELIRRTGGITKTITFKLIKT